MAGFATRDTANGGRKSERENKTGASKKKNTPALRRLENLNVKTSDAQDLYNNFYQYDKVGNVTSLINLAGTTANTMGGNYWHDFEYDNLNRLAGAKGYFKGDGAQQQNNNDFQSDYSITMQYNATHGIENKTQLHYKNLDATPVAANTYSNTYKYEDNTHKVAHIDDRMTGATEDFSYDLNGNLIYKTNTDGSDCSLYWDESNRLRVVKDPAGMQHYIYDASGERILKANSNTEAVYGNGSLLDLANTTINSYATHPSAFLVVDAHGIYSKHYFAGTQRIVSRIGEQSSSIFGDVSPKMSGNKGDNKLQELQKTNLQQILAKSKLGQATFKPYHPYTYDEAQKALAEGDTVAKAPGQPPLYFYHPDHLGTSTFLTDYNGNAYQFFLNLPFGETMAEQLGSNYYNTPYKFNGKELDEETGLYYYGARYYDPNIGNWLSVDPLAEMQPNKSPYQYCSNNPINMIDPTGMLEHDYEKDDNGQVKLIKKTSDSTDRLLAKNGDVIDNSVQKGVLHDGMNLGGDVNLISLSQKNENGDRVDMDEISDMLFKVSVYDQKEISWGRFTSASDKNGYAVINPYKNNLPDEATSNVWYSFSRNNQKYFETDDYHTHPSFQEGYGYGNPSQAGGDLSRIMHRKGTNGYIISREAELTRYDFNGGNDGLVNPLKIMRPQMIDKNYVKKTWGWKKKF